MPKKLACMPNSPQQGLQFGALSGLGMQTPLRMQVCPMSVATPGCGCSLVQYFGLAWCWWHPKCQKHCSTSLTLGCFRPVVFVCKFVVWHFFYKYVIPTVQCTHVWCMGVSKWCCRPAMPPCTLNVMILA